jgi:hypothetical protein
MLYSNALLFDLILCLARRVDECCGALTVKSLFIVSGDNQTAPVKTDVGEPLVTRVVDGGNPVANEDVTFDVVPGGGSIGTSPTTLGQTLATKTDANGLATCPVWRLGPVPGQHRVTARIASGTPALVTFVARASKAVVTLPVIRRLWPSPALHLDPRSPDPINVRWYRDWIGSPRIEISFNVQMLSAHLAKPAPWLRVSLVRNHGQNEIEVRPLPLQYAGPAAQPILGQPGEFTEVFALRAMRPGDLTRTRAAPMHATAVPSATAAREVRILVQVHAASGNIVDTVTPPQLLDAEFMGARMGRARFTEIFQLTDVRTFPQDVWDALGPTGAMLPQSGDGAEGGDFIAWFAIEPAG